MLTFLSKKDFFGSRNSFVVSVSCLSLSLSHLQHLAMDSSSSIDNPLTVPAEFSTHSVSNGMACIAADEEMDGANNANVDDYFRSSLPDNVQPLPAASTFLLSSTYHSAELLSNLSAPVPPISSFARPHVVEVLRSSTTIQVDEENNGISSSVTSESSLTLLQRAQVPSWEEYAKKEEWSSGEATKDMFANLSRLPPISRLHIPEIPAFVHRSISSPVLGGGGTGSSSGVDNNTGGSSQIDDSDDDSGSHTSSNTFKLDFNRKRKSVPGTLNYPKADPPAICPRFQWHQARGVVRVHLLVKNVLPLDLKVRCTGRDLDIRLRADECSYPPTRPDPLSRPMIEYHLPLRLPHRVYVEPEFQRISPSRVELHYRKVKPLVEWMTLWKNVRKSSAENQNGNLLEKSLESSSDSEDDEVSDDNDEDSRPSKKLMNRKEEADCSASVSSDNNADTPPSTPDLIPLSLDEKAADTPLAVFIVGPVAEEESDQEGSTPSTPTPQPLESPVD